ncbi:hypothetical protein [Umezawaea sp. Da 62-37]|uniref:hypothetical protein n=1 Tax=Umezawaea sp. Da 62-37 TaxID=3075927 RepID=UPI0028F6CBDE|nr:hypothetical protein [Umezawaea sp. Da 62-37]WNV89166.1 hypothetical protein RM788_12945 [Umezawaea sp. Da 62-37]
MIPGLVQSVLLLATRRFTDRRVTVRLGGSDATMRVAEVDCTLGALGMALGQFDDVRLVVEDVEWADRTARRLAVTCRDVHVNPGPTLVAGPVDVELVLASRDLPDVEVGPDGVLRWAFVPLAPSVEDGELWVTTGFLPLRRRIAVPPLPGGLRLTGVTTRPDEVVLTARSELWRERVPLGSLVKLLRPA